MRISEGMLRGYLLEEALAKLVENSGYNLITTKVLNKPDLNPEFTLRANGLNIKGRGGIHQADVLGQFPFSLPFTYPVRLFLEAKFRSSKTGIDVIRSGIGILQDLNSNYQTIDLNGQELLTQRYNYQYAIFSTSGFSNNAIKLAIAHKVHLIDLSGNEYEDLRNVIKETAQNIYRQTENYSLNDIRQVIRNEFFRTSLDRSDAKNQNLHKILHRYFIYIRNFGDLFLASTNSPFTILLKPFSSEDFKYLLQYTRKTTFNVNITWNDNEKRHYWTISIDNFQDLTFSFALPTLLAEYIFKQQTKDQQASSALDAKQRYFNNIIFYLKDLEQFITLKYIMPDLKSLNT
ncbi:hypothetical protein BWGOE13_55180 [Bacillus mycoides]|uniref:Restriction endonuclease type IV Mrr domain-containing protein n=1 Tax=Bacillus mycoides TaxID=1405 RepID=A0A1E8BL16_BACMY|nr:hypothetical protein [Bacillus mycoides]OFD90551.1 hypothetical protein BWGOE11_34150 [Bacillus mycoides]OFD91318.1 hypothetical protein BWGOE13_55180 [Bacillus mycoides]